MVCKLWFPLIHNKCILLTDMSASYGFLGWINCCKGTSMLHQNGLLLSPHLSDIGTGGAVYDNFWNFLKPTIWRSRPLHTMISQLCRGEKVSRFELLSKTICHFSCEHPIETLWMSSRSDCPKMCAVTPHDDTISQPSVSVRFCFLFCIQCSYIFEQKTQQYIQQSHNIPPGSFCSV